MDVRNHGIADLDDIPNASVDSVVSVGALSGKDDAVVAAALAEAMRILKPDKVDFNKFGNLRRTF